jgi:ribonucleoside-diphosphate reductase alpha chain
MKAQERPKQLNGFTHKINTGCGKLYVTINLKDGNLFEIFAKLGKSGGCSACTTEALTRAISIGLRAGVDPDEYFNTLVHISCQSQTFDEGVKICSCPDAIAQVIKGYLPKEE